MDGRVSVGAIRPIWHGGEGGVAQTQKIFWWGGQAYKTFLLF